MAKWEAASAEQGLPPLPFHTLRRSDSAHYGCCRHALRYLLLRSGVPADECRRASLLLRLQVCHAGLEPQTIRPQTSLLLIRLTLALDSWGSHCHERLDVRADDANPNPNPSPNPKPKPNTNANANTNPNPNQVRADDPRIHKGTKPNIDSYSAFFDNCKANDTGLTALLEAEGVTDVFVCGLVFDICVKVSPNPNHPIPNLNPNLNPKPNPDPKPNPNPNQATAVHGAEMGFSVSVIEDGCRPLDPKNNKDVKAELAAAGVSVISAGEAAQFARANAGAPKPLHEVLSAAHQSRGAHHVLAKLEAEGGGSTMNMVPPPPPWN